ncbi:HD-GYP domain-containing protein [Simiduia aestuariiviva]|uniref:Putative nucleotidyltransferase with HDIG domain n=1 Tax=Simiduia aestuariiviva TaxID=1510459 RepID=A0A839UTR4_9GAMM|nr:HD-GYP domain-containing protein [Simiduia aestuariiviva]MBB3170111.1 putative nucleotidyltransferase with HDIG domain [Simiduia aestuariiviva]
MAQKQLKKIPKHMLVVGMFIEEFCGSWMEHPFWRGRFLLENEADRKRVLESSITELWIDASRGADISEAQAQACPPVAAPDVAALAQAPTKKVELRVSMAQELVRARKICDRSQEAVAQMFSEARMGNAVNAEQCRAMVEEISSSVSRNPGALISLARLKSADEYTYLHSVAVCALMIALARELGLSEAQVQQAGLAGLLHDMGKAQIPAAVLNKPGRLTDEEFAVVKAHPQKGYDMLLEAGSASAEVMDACLHHHEKVDGSGYPKGLKGDEITLLTKMTAICDVYDAITSNRPYKHGWDPAESVRKMAEWSGHFDERVFQAFVKSIGIYPTGSLVRLKSNRLAVVVEQAERSLLKPKVKVFYSMANKARIPPQLVDLAAPNCTEAIDGRESPERWQFKDLDELWQPA